MYTIIILFIAVVLIIGIFCVTVVCRDIVLEERERKNKQPEKQTVAMPEQNAEPTEEIAATEITRNGRR